MCAKSCRQFVLGLLFTLGFQCFSAHAIEFDLKIKDEGGKRSLYFDYAGHSSWMAPIETLKRGSRLYHWGAEGTILNKLQTCKGIQDGSLSMDRFNDVIDPHGIQGPAIYTSMDDWDSMAYGTHLMLLDVPVNSSVVHWDLVKSYPRSHPELGIPEVEFADYRSKINAKLLSIGVAATYMGADSLDSNQDSDHSDGSVTFDGYHYVAVQSPSLTPNVKLADANDVLALINSSTAPTNEVEAIARLIHLANLKTISVDEIHWDWSRFPITKKLIMGATLDPDEKQALMSYPNHTLLFTGCDENGQKPLGTSQNRLALWLAENLYNEKQCLFFLINLNRANLINKKAALDLEQFTVEFPRLHNVVIANLRFLGRIKALMSIETGPLWESETNERIYKSLMLDRSSWVKSSAVDLLLETWMRPIFLKDTVTLEQQKSFQQLIQGMSKGNTDQNFELAQALKSRFPALCDLMGSENTCGDATIEEHSLKVMELFDEQERHYQVDPANLRIKDQESFQHLTGLMKTIIALHDIGKPFGRRQQHANTDPIVHSVLSQLGFSFTEVQFARAFLETDLLGEMIIDSSYQDKDINEIVGHAYSELLQQSERANVPVREFYKLLCNFYIADANFYSGIREYFEDELGSGKRIPKGERSLSAWRELERRVLGVI